MIKAFRFCAQAIFSLLEKTHAPAWFTKFEFDNFFLLFYIISTHRSYIHKKLDTNSCFAKLRANSYLFSFLYTLYSVGITFLSDLLGNDKISIYYKCRYIING
jgi:hypothetical protein